MPTIGFSKIDGGPEEALKFVLKKLREEVTRAPFTGITGRETCPLDL
ncbi:hypothetical protein [Pyrococcus kukulkanii]